jgi:uncharacterized DUF497 family protein
MFEWDKSKAKANKSKHGISFADTFAVFEDLNAVTLEDSRKGEQRYATIGMDAFGRILVVVYTWTRRQHSNHFSTQGCALRGETI